MRLALRRKHTNKTKKCLVWLGFRRFEPSVSIYQDAIVGICYPQPLLIFPNLLGSVCLPPKRSTPYKVKPCKMRQQKTGHERNTAGIQWGAGQEQVGHHAIYRHFAGVAPTATTKSNTDQKVQPCGFVDAGFINLAGLLGPDGSHHLETATRSSSREVRTRVPLFLQASLAGEP